MYRRHTLTCSFVETSVVSSAMTLQKLEELHSSTIEFLIMSPFIAISSFWICGERYLAFLGEWRMWDWSSGLYLLRKSSKCSLQWGWKRRLYELAGYSLSLGPMLMRIRYLCSFREGRERSYCTQISYIKLWWFSRKGLWWINWDMTDRWCWKFTSLRLKIAVVCNNADSNLSYNYSLCFTCQHCLLK